MEEWIALLQNFGFPVIVALYFMFRVEKTMEKMTESNNNLAGAIQALRVKLDGKTPTMT